MSAPIPIIFGEVLFDCFEDGSEVLGGAPFNVAWHLQGFGANPLLISRVGHDALGEKILQTMRQWHMRTDGIQQDEEHATGMVQVSLRNNQPSFDIVGNVAYDCIDASACGQVLSSVDSNLFYHGSLAARGSTSRATLQALLGDNRPVFLDINLRPPHWDAALVDNLMRSADWLKLNDQELLEITGAHAGNVDAMMKLAEQLRQDKQLTAVIVTLGANGAFVAAGDGVHSVAPVKVNKLVDTVGAGDAFSSVFILGQLKQWNYNTTLQRAVNFAAAVCEQRGATRQDPGFYENLLHDWDNAR
jgi:fructokinase